MRGEIDQRLSELAEIIEGKRAIPQEDWKTPNLQNGWEFYGGEYNKLGYFKDSFGIVHLKGLVRKGSGIIFTLPDGYRPVGRELHAVCTNPNALGRIDIRSNGNVMVVAGSEGWISLDGLTFRAK